MNQVIEWIKNNIKARRTPNTMHTSYGIKHLYERETGEYITNDDFKAAMLFCGFHPVNEQDTNWCFCISEKSPAFKEVVSCQFQKN